MSEIELETQDLLSITQAASRIPGRPHVATVHRWVHSGLQGVRLDSWKVGGKRFTSIEAIERFIAATTALSNGDSLQPRTRRVQEQAVSRAERIAQDHGI